MDEQFNWQVMHPKGTREDCLEHLGMFYSANFA